MDGLVSPRVVEISGLWKRSQMLRNGPQPALPRPAAPPLSQPAVHAARILGVGQALSGDMPLGGVGVFSAPRGHLLSLLCGPACPAPAPSVPPGLRDAMRGGERGPCATSSLSLNSTAFECTNLNSFSSPGYEGPCP